ncbi:pectinesterase [Aspergillus lentulus]|nr:pectinesterase [Aspergillus lentulus]
MLGLSLVLAACVAVTQASSGYPVARDTSGTCSGVHARVSPPAGAIVVDNSANPHPGSHATVQAGVDALNTTTADPQQLFIFPGTYTEQVYIPRLTSNLTVQGYTCNTKSYQHNKVTITYNLALINTTSDDLTATLRQWNPNTKIYNLNIVNSFGHIPQNGQNLAVSAEADGQAYYACQLIGYQDTLLAETGRQLYAKSLIKALAWLESIDIRTIASGSITASGRDSDSNPSWYVISRSNVSAINNTIPAGISYLGRPWRDYARVVFQETYLGNNIAAAGWSQWSTSTPNTDHVTFAEYKNYGPGSVSQEGPRANFSQQLTAPISIRSILGEMFQDECLKPEATCTLHILLARSIGSVGGKSNNNATNILFSNSAIYNSQNGCRIKTNYSITGYIANITYSNISVQNTSVYGVDVQQDCLNGGPTGCPSNGALIENVSFRNVVGTAGANVSDYYVLCGEWSCRGFPI